MPSPLHFALAHEFVMHDVDVLVEKPLTTTVAEGRALVAAAEQRGRILQVGHLERFNPAIRALAGVVTHPRFIECHRLAPFVERGTDVDVILDLMIHDLDVILSLVHGDVQTRSRRSASRCCRRPPTSPTPGCVSAAAASPTSPPAVWR